MPDAPDLDFRLAPHLTVDGAAAAIDFYAEAFGATELIRMPAPDGRLIHASVAINGAVVMLVDENRQWNLLSPLSLGGTPVTIHLQVADCDAAVAKAQAAGATVLMPPADQFWGDRYGVVQDPFGHKWSIATPLADAPRTAGELKAAADGFFATQQVQGE